MCTLKVETRKIYVKESWGWEDRQYEKSENKKRDMVGVKEQLVGLVGGGGGPT